MRLVFSILFFMILVGVSPIEIFAKTRMPVTNKLTVGGVGPNGQGETVAGDLKERSVKWRYAVPGRLINSADSGYHETTSPLSHIRKQVFELALSNPHCLHELNVLIVDEVNKVIGQENFQKIEKRYGHKTFKSPVLATVFDIGTTSLSGDVQASTEVHYFLIFPDEYAKNGKSFIKLLGLKSEQMETFSFCELVENFETEKEALLASFFRNLNSKVRLKIKKILLDFEEDFGELNSPGNSIPSDLDSKGATTIL